MLLLSPMPHCEDKPYHILCLMMILQILKTQLLVLECSAFRFYSIVLNLTLHGTNRNTANHVTLLKVGCAEMSFVCCPPPTDVIHTVGPVARGHVGPTETNDLTSCYQNSLRLMKEHGLSTVVSTVC